MRGRVRGGKRERGGEGPDNDAAWMETHSRSESNPAFQEIRETRYREELDGGCSDERKKTRKKTGKESGKLGKPFSR
jgi:hypothetical protein